MGITYNTSVVKSGLVLHLDAANVKSYPGSGTVWNDLSGNGGYATAYNSPTYIPMESFNFDGASDYFRFVRSDLNGGTFAYTNITVEIWIKPGSGNTGSSQGNNLCTVENSFEISIGNLGNGYSAIQYASNPWAWYGTTTNGLINDTWNQLTYVHATTGRWIYVNGVQVFYRNDTGNISAGSAGYPYLTLMGRYDGTGSSAEGNLSSVKLYNRTLSQAEIKQNFESLRGRYGI